MPRSTSGAWPGERDCERQRVEERQGGGELASERKRKSWSKKDYGLVSAAAEERAILHIHSNHSINTRKHSTLTPLAALVAKIWQKMGTPAIRKPCRAAEASAGGMFFWGVLARRARTPPKNSETESDFA